MGKIFILLHYHMFSIPGGFSSIIFKVMFYYNTYVRKVFPYSVMQVLQPLLFLSFGVLFWLVSCFFNASVGFF